MIASTAPAEIRLLLVKDDTKAVLHIEGEIDRNHTITGREELVRERAAELYPGLPILEPKFI